MTTILASTDTEVIIALEPYLSGLNYAVVVYGQQLIEENPDLGNRFMVAYLKGVRQYLEGPTERNLEIISAATGVDAETLAGICWPYMRPDGVINYAGSLDWQNWELANDRLEAIVPEEVYWNRSFVDAANEVLGAP
ncbi:MAG: hypothetical protein EPO32_11055 [Anaerolineae bacterium]|nr:MAG: hypothetical protein EPO32_11055 [Anaerolineae bacterium]